MQTFYERLIRAMEVHDPRLESLTRLTRLDPARVHHLQTALSWSDWPTTTA